MEKESLEARKFAEGEYRITQKIDHCKVELAWREGGLYLTLSDILFSHGEQYYVIPIREIERISVLKEKPIRLLLEFGNIEIEFTGEAGHKLSALRHLLLPYIKGEKGQEKMKLLLLYWVMGIHSPKALSALLSISQDECEMLIAQAKDENYISNNGKITRKGIEMFTLEEREMLDTIMRNKRRKEEVDG